MGNYYLHKSDYEEWKVKIPSRRLGKHIGYCTNCGIMMGSLEIDKPCTRCGTVFKIDRTDNG